MKKIHHWTHELPEGKRIFSSQVNEIDLKKLRVKNICNELELLEKELIDLEIKLTTEASKQYSEEEIEEALYKYLIEMGGDLFKKMIGIKTENHENNS